MSELGEFLGELSRQVQRANQTNVEQGGISTWFQNNYYRVKVKCVEVLIEKEDVAGNAFILGHPSLSVLPVVLGTGTYSMDEHETLTNPSDNITHVGRLQFSKWIGAETPDRPQWISWGDDNTAFTQNDTELGNEIRMASGGSTNSKPANAKVKLTYEFAASATTGTMREVGIFDANAAGNMWFRTVMTNPLTITSTLSTRISFTFEIVDETDLDSALITTYGLNHMRDFIYDGTAVFTKTEWSDGVLLPNVGDTSLDGSNYQENTIDSRKRNGFVIEISTILTTAQFNNNKLGKVGNNA